MVRSTGDEKMLVPLLKGPGGERIGRVFEKSGDFFEVFFSGVEMPLEREDSKFTAREYARDAETAEKDAEWNFDHGSLV